MKNTSWPNKPVFTLMKLLMVCIFSGCSLFLLVSGNLPPLGASSSYDIHIEPQPPFFSPNQLTIAPGTPLTWKNRTQEPHTIVSDDCRFGNNCSFDSGFLAPNARFALPSLKPGRYPYHCSIHPFMRGSLTIHSTQPFSSSDI